MAFDPWADYDNDQKEAAEGSSFKPIPVGARDFNLFEAEVVAYSNKPDSPYAGLKALKVQLKVPDGEEYGNRRVFTRVPLFPKSPPNNKGESYVQYDFFNFFEKSLGWTQEQLKAFALKLKSGQDVSADLRPYLGTRVGAILSIKAPDEWNPEGSNDVKRFAAASGAKAASAAATVPADAWASAAPAQSNLERAQDPWTVPAEDVAFAQAAAAGKGF